MKNDKVQQRIRVFTWHVHGAYLYYLHHADVEVFIPVKKNSEEGYGKIPIHNDKNWRNTIHEIPAEEVRNYEFDCILFQSKKNYQVDQYEILSLKQRSLPGIYLEHDPPQEHPTNTKHVVNDPLMLIVHVTNYNSLMWDTGSTPTAVISHGVTVPTDVSYIGDHKKGVVVVNNLSTRGRRLGKDIFERIRKYVPLDLIGIDSMSMGGIGEIPHYELPALLSRYRFFFNPARYTSLPLALCEAMMVGLPIISLATTEIPHVIQNSVNGFSDNNIHFLITKMNELITNFDTSRRMSVHTRLYAETRFSIERFAKDWESIFSYMVKRDPQAKVYQQERDFEVSNYHTN